MKKPLATAIAICSIASYSISAAGKRPYELDWASRTNDDHPPLVDFETDAGWQVECENAIATFETTDEQQIWGKYVGKLTYRSTGPGPIVRILPPAPIKVTHSFDAVSCWIYGNNWAWHTDRSTPRVSITVLFQSTDGKSFQVPLATVRWKEWFLCHRRLGKDLIAEAEKGLAFTGIEVRNGRNKDDRALFFDNLAVFAETFPPLTFSQRPQRGIPMFPGQPCGTNTGRGRLPFPVTPRTICPTNLCKDSTSLLEKTPHGAQFRYHGSDGDLTYRITPESGTWTDVQARWDGRTDWIRPLVEGGIRIEGPDGKTRSSVEITLMDAAVNGDAFRTRWQFSDGHTEGTVEYTFRLWGKTLVVDTVSLGGHCAEVVYGTVVDLHDAEPVALPYYDYGGSRPTVIVGGAEAAPIFLSGHSDWYLSNGSVLWGSSTLGQDKLACNGGVRYIPKTDGKRNDCYERFFITMSPEFREVLPNIPNPVSPWKHITGTHVWRAHGAGNRQADAAHWRHLHRLGLRKLVVTDHETGWRDGGESFTFRTRPAPGKGGDEGQFEYARIMQDELGFVYGPYNNFTDFAPVNEFWSADLINRTSDNQLQQAWARCYAPKPARAVEYCERLAPIIEQKFHFSTAYCDVHTCVTPWSRVDYDWRVPGSGTFAAVFYAYGEIMLLQKAAWGGPVYSEGGKHCFYCGLTDGNYGQDQAYGLPVNPWLLDFDLRKLHDLCCNFGMGNPGMFYGKKKTQGKTPEETARKVDRFLAATVAFGHPGFLVLQGGDRYALKSYFMLQQLQSRYTQAGADTIGYITPDGSIQDTSTALRSGSYKRSQVTVRYSDGTRTVVNGHPEDMLTCTVDDREMVLPPNGYAGWTVDGQIEVFSGLQNGHRCDYARTPDYLYVDGRGEFVRFPAACGNGTGLCRDDGESYEVLLYGESICGFAVEASLAVALNAKREVIGPAELRRSRGLVYVMPVPEAFSYRLQKGPAAAKDHLQCSRFNVLAGETVSVKGLQQHEFRIPTDAKPGQHIWERFEDAWTDFVVAPFCKMTAHTEPNGINLEVMGCRKEQMKGTVTCREHSTEITLSSSSPCRVDIPLSAPKEPSAEILNVAVQGDFAHQTAEWGLITRWGKKRLVTFEKLASSGSDVRNASDTPSVADTGAACSPQEDMSCGDVPRNGIFMHPPWKKGCSGRTYGITDQVDVPADVPCEFRALVGKKDGSYLGDGILFSVSAIDAEGQEQHLAETHVPKHEWLPIVADLNQYAGKKIYLKLICDAGKADNTSGDWGCWADMRIETSNPILLRSLTDDTRKFRHEPGPHRPTASTSTALQECRAGWLCYQGIGLTGTGGTYETYAVLNGCELGPMAPAGGKEVEGVWSETVRVPLTPEALKSLRSWNIFSVRNPGEDCFKLRNVWLELETEDGSRFSSDLTPSPVTQPGKWRYAEGILVPFSEPLEIYVWIP